MTDFEQNKADVHLQNLVRQVREELQQSNPVMAFVKLQVLENYLFGLRFDGTPWNKKDVRE